MTDIIEDLKTKESTFRKLQDEKSRWMGQFEQLKNDLEAKFKVGNIEDAKKLLEEKDARLEELTVKGDVLLAKIDTEIQKAKNDIG